MKIVRSFMAAALVSFALMVVSFVGLMFQTPAGSSPPPRSTCPFLATMHGTFAGIPLHKFWVQTTNDPGFQICNIRGNETAYSIVKETWTSNVQLPGSPNHPPSGSQDAHFQTEHSGQYLITRAHYRLPGAAQQYVQLVRVSHVHGFVAISAFSDRGDPNFDTSEAVALSKQILKK